MRIIDRYLAGSVIRGTLLTLGALLPLLGVLLLADELDAIGRGDYGPAEALLFMLLRLPRYLYQIFPISTLIGALLGLGALASRSELVALRAAGVSVGQLTGAALLGGLVLALVVFALGELIAPSAEQRGVELKRQALSGEAAQLTPYGLWAIDKGAYVNIREIRSGTHLRDISIYRIDPVKGVLESTYAEGASYQNGRWVLEGIARSLVSAEGVRVEHLDRTEWESMIDPGLLRVIIADPQALPVWGLYAYIDFMKINKQDARVYEVAFWNKVLHPLVSLSMILVAIPLLLGSARTVGLGRRMLVATLIGLIYYLISRTLAYASLLLGMSPALAALAPPVLLCTTALILLRRLG
ncbi:LPS export ABC transporter permease LptG [Caldichromatium japonicum]|uniref:LPS export ABC transporter permease LptG n=1 Tax=Caldichromatium japonicum TaxID=2699430 RepID=A0A6G7VDD0_9GAMM|nr:LPS export ABC transporter permease LptG [Caldichromatium japonicum]QIK37797.1 LPS export ABC transporter permease LptG [Caldichromatium japonicum]